MSAKEIKSLTGIRGLAAIYVIAFHWNAEIAKKTPVPGSSTAEFLMLKLLGHGYLSVDLFFILSGFVLCITYAKVFSEGVSVREYDSFMLKRFARIFPLYIVVTLLYFLAFHYTDFKNLWMNLTLMHGLNYNENNSIIPPGWSLTNEWVVYFIFPFLFFLLRKVKRVWAIMTAALLILLFLSCYRSLYFNWSNYSYLKKLDGFNPVISFTRGPASFLRTITAYLLGAFTFFWLQKQQQLSFLRFLWMPLFTLMFVLMFISRTDILIILAMPFFIIYLTMDNRLSRFLSLKAIHFLGLISYSLYVNHYLFIKTYKSFSHWAGMDSLLLSLGYVLVCSLIFSTLTYYMIEKPGVALIRRFTGRAAGQ